MDQQKIMWFILFLLGISFTFYFFVIDEERISTMSSLNESDIELKGDVNATTELYDRFDLRLIGHSKHLKNIQDETDAHYKKYSEKMDSLDNALDVISFNIDHLDETLTKRIDGLKSSLGELNDLFDSYKRTTNRSINDLKNDVTTLKGRVETNANDLRLIMSLELIDKAIRKKQEKEARDKEN